MTEILVSKKSDIFYEGPTKYGERMNSIQVSINDRCAICQTDYLLPDSRSKVDICVQLACQHIFHENCLQDWMDINSSCPLCRKKLKVKNSDFHVYVLKGGISMLICWQLSHLFKFCDNKKNVDMFMFFHYLALCSVLVMTIIIGLDWNPQCRNVFFKKRGLPEAS